MKSIVLALAAGLVATAAAAQAPPPPAPPPPTPDGPGMRPPPPPPPPPHAQGAHIKLEAPGGGEISVRCATGEPTRVCADIALDLLDKVKRPRDDGQRWDRGRDDRYRDGRRRED